MKDKIESMLKAIDVQIQESEERQIAMVSRFNDEKCILKMALNSPKEINSIEEFEKE